MSRISSTGEGGGCGCILITLAINLTIGGIALNYVLASVLGKTIPWYAAAPAGMIFGEVTIPAALICWIVRLCGVAAPFIPHVAK